MTDERKKLREAAVLEDLLDIEDLAIGVKASGIKSGERIQILAQRIRAMLAASPRAEDKEE